MSGLSAYFLRYVSKSESTKRRQLLDFLGQRLAHAEAQGNDRDMKNVLDKAES